jgi:hypothetical protein
VMITTALARKSLTCPQNMTQRIRLDRERHSDTDRARGVGLKARAKGRHVAKHVRKSKPSVWCVDQRVWKSVEGCKGVLGVGVVMVRVVGVKVGGGERIGSRSNFSSVL